MVIRKLTFERADVVRALNTDEFGVVFRKKTYELKSNNWDDAQREAEELLDKKFPDVKIIVD